MNVILNIILAVFLFLSVENGDIIVGKWKLENNLDVEIYEQNGKYYGKIIALNGFNDDQKLDNHNPDKMLRDRSLVGIVIMRDLEYNEEDEIWENGQMYAPHMGMTANLEIKKVENDVITAVGSKFIFWHTENWVKIK